MTMTSQTRTTNGRGRLYDSVLDTVGDTPCIRVNLGPDGVDIYVKAASNPAASVKQNTGPEHHRGSRTKRYP